MKILVRGSRNLPSAKWKCSCRIRPAGLRFLVVTSPWVRNSCVSEPKWQNFEKYNLISVRNFNFTYLYWWVGWDRFKDDEMKAKWHARVGAKTSSQYPNSEPDGYCTARLSQMTSLSSHFNMILPAPAPSPTLAASRSMLYLFCFYFLLLPSCSYFIEEFLNFPAVHILVFILQIVKI